MRRSQRPRASTNALITIALLLSSAEFVTPDDDGHTAADENEKFSFLAIGDWGGREIWPYETFGQATTSKGMSSVAASAQSSFVLALGDNFYSHGIATNEDDQRFVTTFEKVYHQANLQNIPWYVTAGNHDHLGNITAQIQYHDESERWTFPDLFYTVRKDFILNDHKMSAQFIFTDSVVLAGMPIISDPSDPAYLTSPLSGPADAQLASDKFEWIEQQLANAYSSDDATDFIFVVGHYPIYSACSHGNTAVLIDKLDPMLRKYGVTAYLSGHDHCQMHITKEEMEYILTGTGDECCYDATNIENLPAGAKLNFLVARGHNDAGITGGFASFVEAQHNTTSMLVVRFHDQHGREMYKTELRPKNRTKGRVSPLSTEGGSTGEGRK